MRRYPHHEDQSKLRMAMGAEVRNKNTQPDESLDLELEALIATVESMGT